MLLGLWVLFEVELLQEKQETGPSSLFPTRGAVAVDQHYWLTDRLGPFFFVSTKSHPLLSFSWPFLLWDKLLLSLLYCYIINSQLQAHCPTVWYQTLFFSLLSLVSLLPLSAHMYICQTFAISFGFFVQQNGGPTVVCHLLSMCIQALSLSLSGREGYVLWATPSPPPSSKQIHAGIFFPLLSLQSLPASRSLYRCFVLHLPSKHLFHMLTSQIQTHTQSNNVMYFAWWGRGGD